MGDCIKVTLASLFCWGICAAGEGASNIPLKKFGPGPAPTTTTAFPMVARDYPLRKFGTNAFDFTPIIRAIERREVTNSVFLVVGEVLQIRDNCVHIVQVTSARFQYREPDERWLKRSGPEDLLKLVAAQRLAGTNGLSLGRYLTLSPQMKEYFELVRQYKRVFVTNCPAMYRVQGQKAEFLAMPAGKYTFVDTANEAQTVQLYDYGEPIFRDLKDQANVFLVTPRGVVKKESSQEAAARKAATTANLIAWHQQQASNDVAYAQYELAKRYLNGDSVPKDEVVGFYWLRRAATNDYEPAVMLLKTTEKQKQ